MTRPVATTGLEVNTGVIIPRKGLLEVKRLLEEASTSRRDRTARLQCLPAPPGVTLSVKLIDAQFPDYEQVVPKQIHKKAIISRQHLIDALRRISLLSSDKSWGVRMTFSTGLLQITSDNPDLGEAREEIEIEFDAPGEVTVGFNARYLLDVLAATASADVTIGINDESSPGVIIPTEDPDYTCVIMPMRI